MTPSVSLSPAALEAVRSQIAKRGGGSLRLGLKGGGCSGFSYVLAFDDDAPREKDHRFDFDGVTVLVDPKSMLYLNGTVLDWEKTLMWTGFKFRNPNEKSSCGCGSSFNV